MHMDRAIRTLGGKKLVERVPSHTLNIVRVLGDFTYNGAVRRVMHPCSIVGASCDDVFAVRTPRQVVHLAGRCAGNRYWMSRVYEDEEGGRLPYNNAGSPVFFLILQLFCTVPKVMHWPVGGRPYGEHAIVPSGRDKFACTLH